MIIVEDVSISIIGSQNQIEITFLHNRKWSNNRFQFFIPSKFYPMFSRYVGEICQDWVAIGNLQFLKKWNKFAKKRTQNTSKNNINSLHVVACKILKSSKNGYSSHFWRRNAATNFANAGLLLINLKPHGQWASDRVVEGKIVNSLPLYQQRLNCLSPAKERSCWAGK